ILLDTNYHINAEGGARSDVLQGSLACVIPCCGGRWSSEGPGWSDPAPHNAGGAALVQRADPATRPAFGNLRLILLVFCRIRWDHHPEGRLKDMPDPWYARAQ